MSDDKDKKAEEKSKKAELKVLDENDEAFCGYCSIQTLDQDGISGRTLGSHVKAPAQIVSAPGADPVVFEAVFNPSNPLFFLELRNEEQFYLWGQWWMDGPKHSEASQICSLVPIRMVDCHKQMDSSPGEFKAQAHCEVLRSSTTRLLPVALQTEEKKFKTKLSKVTFSMPRDAWMEFKQYRVRLWKAGNNWKGVEKDEDEDKKKDEEKKEAERPPRRSGGRPPGAAA
eukprot:CAMPEP_0176216888 /NCGR_PEP_ID=MMETSP0121_2-20121125/17415_1 /TAXON_ID=160619 /ORGANISM="Kryptoperidinium foliaceum, Strain CCMP 1326" /LENGTH=227 /DNA_ID=CAMNT_0017556013 /DNA_START=59 /DNA_END=739 /DNA_ORIENTATION=-